MKEDLKLHERLMFWIAMVLPPLVWFINLGVTYAFASDACAGGSFWPIYVTMVVSLGIAAGASAFAYREWKRMGSPRHALDPGEKGLVEFLAAGGRLLTTFFLVVTAVALLPPIVFGGCLL